MGRLIDGYPGTKNVFPFIMAAFALLAWQKNFKAAIIVFYLPVALPLVLFGIYSKIHKVGILYPTPYL